MYQDNSGICKVQAGDWEERRGEEFESLGVLKREHMRKWSASAAAANKG